MKKSGQSSRFTHDDVKVYVTRGFRPCDVCVPPNCGPPQAGSPHGLTAGLQAWLGDGAMAADGAGGEDDAPDMPTLGLNGATTNATPTRAIATTAATAATG